MAASKVMMSSSTSRNSDLNNNKLVAPLSADGMYAYPETHSTQITLLDKNSNSLSQQQPARKTVDDVWRDIVAGRRGGGGTSKNKGKKMKMEVPEEMMTLEDFLVRAGAVEEEEEEVEEVKMPIPLTGYSFDSISLNPFHSGGGSSSMGFGNEGMSKRRASSLVVGLGLEPLDKAAEQRQRRMIKNRESAARSRERKQV